MPANLFGDRFTGRRVPAWHNVGTIFDDDPDIVEAITRAKMDYSVFLREVFFKSPIGEYQTIPNRRVLVREQTEDDPERAFAIVSDQYEVIQNVDLAIALRPLAERWPVETAGALGFGERFFLTLDAGSTCIAGDEIRRYFLIIDDKSGEHTLTLLFTPVRVVCENTLITGMRRATMRLDLQHRGGVQSYLAVSLDAIGRAQQSIDETMAVMAELARTQVAQEDIAQIILAAYPEPTRPRKLIEAGELSLSDALTKPEIIRLAEERWEKSIEAQVSARVSTSELYNNIASTNPLIALTPWAAYNAVVEFEDFGRQTRGQEAMASIIGERAKPKIRAFGAAMSYIRDTSRQA